MSLKIILVIKFLSVIDEPFTVSTRLWRLGLRLYLKSVQSGSKLSSRTWYLSCEILLIKVVLLRSLLKSGDKAWLKLLSITHADITRVGNGFSGVYVFVCLSVCLFFYTISQIPMQLGSPNSRIKSDSCWKCCSGWLAICLRYSYNTGLSDCGYRA